MPTNRVSREATTLVPTKYGPCLMVGYRDDTLNTEHVALCFGEISNEPTTLRIHSECITGEAFGSLKCECGPQLDAAMEIASKSNGVVIYMRGQEGRGIGLLNKLKAYSLQEQGLDTVEANQALGLPSEAREYAAAIAIIKDLDIKQIKLMTNNPAKSAALKDSGIEVTETVPLIVGVNDYNRNYLSVKAEQMGHNITPEELQ